MKRYFTLLLPLFLSVILTGQDSVNDPAAKKALENIKEKYGSLDQFRIDYELTIDFPEQPADIQKGSITKKGNSFRLDSDMQTVVSDGQSVWIHLKDINEIQIMDATEGSMASMLDPETFLSEFVEGQFNYAITFDGRENGMTVQHIEFKPLDRGSEYSKLRLKLDKENATMLSLETFQRDGSRYAVKFGPNLTTTGIKSDAFTFDPSDYPDAHVEDLRM